MTQQDISLLQNTTHAPTPPKKKSMEIKILKETQNLEKGSLMSYLAAGSLCIYA